MPESTITRQNRTTVPREILERLGARPGDTLHWEVEGDHARVTIAPPAVLALQGKFKVGPGDPVADVRRVRYRS